jgi:F-type H+-transporting ATPase subunit epsilon
MVHNAANAAYNAQVSPNATLHPTFKLQLISPAQIEHQRPEEKVVLPAVNGQMMVLAKHAPELVALTMGVVRCVHATGDGDVFFIEGGFADIGPEHVTILTPNAKPLHHIEMEPLQEEIMGLQDELPKLADSEMSRFKTQQRLDVLLAQLKALEEYKAA